MTVIRNRSAFLPLKWVLLPAIPLLATTGNLYAQANPSTTPHTLEEVLVTASKREESLQEVMGSVTAFGGAALQQENVQDFNSLVELVPGMVAQGESEDGGEKIAIRGISRTREGASPVAFHVNGVFIGRNGTPFYDLQAIEILRGPSGTVYGRNATAGAVNVKWAKPEEQWHVGGEYRYSSLEQHHLQAFLNIPFLGEGDRRLLGRFAASKRRFDGTADNLLAADDEDPGNIDDQFVRMYLTSEPDDDLQLGLRAVYYESLPDGGPFVASPTRRTRRSGELEAAGAMPLPDDLTKVRSTAFKTFGATYSDFIRVDADVTWSLSELPALGNIDVVFVGGQMRADKVNTFDLDGTELALTEGRKDVSDDIRDTAELRLVSQNTTGIDWIAGAFWYDQSQTNNLDVIAAAYATPSDLGLGPALPLPVPLEVFSQAEVVTRDQKTSDQSHAVFLNVDVDLATLWGAPPIEVSAGIRQNYDKFSIATASTDISISVPMLGIAGVPIVQSRNLRQSADFDATTWELGARWFYSDAGMLYAKTARGYKPGLAQLVDLADGTTIQNSVDPEYLDAIELGWKVSLLEKTLDLNFAAYWYDYQDLQVSQIIPAGVITENAASATINGVEFEAMWSPVPAINIVASGAWMDARYDDYCGTDSARPDAPVSSGCTEEGPIDFSGDQMAAAPEFSAALMASYTWILDAYGSLTSSIKVSWSDEMNRRGLGNPNDTVQAYSNSAARLTWESRYRIWRVSLFVENIEDNSDIYFGAYTPIINGRPDTFSMLNNLPPRIAGVTAEARF